MKARVSGWSHGLTAQISIHLRITAGCVTVPRRAARAWRWRRRNAEESVGNRSGGPAAVPLPKASLSAAAAVGEVATLTLEQVLGVEELVAG